MFKAMLRRSVPVLTLATILFITCAGTAQARTLTPTEQAWSWLRQVWTEGVEGTWGGGVTRAVRSTRPAQALQKSGTSVSPTGGMSLSYPSCTICADQGPGTDPNGFH
jgi:hypothetical protein